jgi:hypothetical protein
MMGQSSSQRRLDAIKQNVNEIMSKIQNEGLTENDRIKSHDILIEYVKELKLILSKTLRSSRIHKAEKRVVMALDELAALEAKMNSVEPHLIAKSLQNLANIEKDIKSMSANLNSENLDEDKKTLEECKHRISIIEEVDSKVGVKKSEVLNAMSSMENVVNNLETEEKLQQAEKKHYNFKLDMKRFAGLLVGSNYEQHKRFLLRMKEEVSQISTDSDKFTQRKKYLLCNIEDSIDAMELMVIENKGNITRQISEDIDAANRNQILIVDLYRSYSQFERTFSANCPLAVLQDVFRQLNELKTRIEQKLSVLENQINVEDDPYMQLVQRNDASLDQPEQLEENRDNAQIELVTVREDFVDAPITSPLVRNKLEKIREEVQNLQRAVAASEYSKESDMYDDFCKILNDYKAELEDLPQGNPEYDQLCSDILKQIDNVLIFVDHNVAGRRSTTGDTLVDIMSISTSVNELGSQMQSLNGTRADYDSIEIKLLEFLYYLNRIQIPLSRSNVCKFRDHVVKQIESLLTKLTKLKSQTPNGWN